MSKIKQYAEELYGENWTDLIETGEEGVNYGE